MPISIPYTYTQTDDAIDIKAQIGTGTVSKANVHIEATPVYLKLNCPPSLLQLDLLHPIDPDRIHLTLGINGSSNVTLRLLKATPGPWSSLTCDQTMEKLQRLKRRQESIVEYETIRNERQRQQQSDKKKQEQDSLETHWNIDKLQREQVLAIQNKERIVASEELASWKKTLPENKIEANVTEDEDQETTPTKATVEEIPELEEEDQPAMTPAEKIKNKNAIWDDADIEETPSSTSSASSSASSTSTPIVSPPSVPLPPVRRGGKVEISFTPDATPTSALPARESVMAQKMAYMATQGLTGTNNAGSDSNEDRELPMFKKERGDTLFRSGELDGAIAAYTSAIQTATRLQLKGVQQESMFVARCHANRGAAHMKRATMQASDVSTAAASSSSSSGIGSTFRTSLSHCIADCTTVFTILVECGPFEDGSSSLLEASILECKTLQRRSTSYAWLGCYTLAKEDLTRLLERLEIMEGHHRSAVRQRKEREIEEGGERKETDREQEEETKTSNSSESSSSSTLPPLPTLPTFSRSDLENELQLCTDLIQRYEQRQHLAFKSVGDSLSEAGDLKGAIEHYTQGLLIHPGHLPTLLNRSATLLRQIPTPTSSSSSNLGAWHQALLDITTGLAIWDELYTPPKVGLAAVAPASEYPSDGTIGSEWGLTPSSTSLSTIQRRSPSKTSLVQRIKLFLRRAGLMVTVLEGSYLKAIQDIQYVLALAPIAGVPLQNIEAELVYLQHRSSQLKLKHRTIEMVEKGSFKQAITEWTKLIELHTAFDTNQTTSSSSTSSSSSVSSCQMLESVSWNVPYGLKDPVKSQRLCELSQLLSERSLTYLKLRDYERCIKDGSAALQVWNSLVESEENGGVASTSPSLPPPPFYTTTLLRMGGARAFRGEFQQAIKDYQRVIEIWKKEEATTTTTTMKVEERQKRLQEERLKVEKDIERIRTFAETHGQTQA